MKQFFKILILTLCLMFPSAQCGNNNFGIYNESKTEQSDTDSIDLSQFGVTDTITPHQLDSICNSDTLPPIGEWVAHTFTDFESGKEITKYTYFKEYGVNSNIVYVVTYDYEQFIIEKRFVR